MKESSVRRENLRRIHRDRQRPFRVLEYLDFHTDFTNCPVELKEGFTVSDRRTGELFLALHFRSRSEKPLAALDVKLVLFEDARLRLSSNDMMQRYSRDDATFGERVLDRHVRTELECAREKYLVQGEEFGQGIFLPLPGSYFQRVQIRLVNVTYGDGSSEAPDLSVECRAVRIPDMQKAEEVQPLRDLSQVQARRALKEEQKVQIRELHDTSGYTSLHRMEKSEELWKRVEAYNRVLDHLAAMEAERLRRRKRLPLKIALLVLVMLIVANFREIYYFCAYFLMEAFR